MACPDDNALTEFIAGALDEAELCRVESHIDACDDCRATLVELARCVHPTTTPPPSPDAAWLSEGVANGRYVPVRALGAGGMSLVYEGVDRRLRRKVAIKVMLDEHSGAGERLVREARALARMSHPNVVDVFDLELRSGHAFLVTELVVGGTMTEWLRERARTADEIVKVLVDSARGLHAAHTQGVIHRDVTPNNILVGDDGRARVADFGLTQRTPDSGSDDDQGPDQHQTMSGGTPGYIAPEVLDGEVAGVAADQYGLSVCGSDALAGVDGVPRRLLGVLAKGQSCAPADRFPSVEALRLALLRAIGPPSRRPIAVTVATAAALIGCVWWGQPRDLPGCAEFSTPAVATGVPAFDRAAQRVVQRWETARTELCASADQDTIVFDRRFECLGRFRTQLEAQVDRVESTGVAKHLRALEQLGDASVCDDDEQVTRSVAVAPPELRARVDAARVELAAVKADLRVLRARDAETRLAPLILEAEDVGHGPLIADVQFVAGQIHRQAGRIEDARRALADAAHRANAAGLDAPAARAWLNLVFTTGNDAMELDAALQTLRHADASLARLGHPPAMMATRAQALGAIYSQRGEHERAAAYLADAVVQFRAALGPHALSVAAANETLGVNQARSGDFDAAHRSLTEARSIVVKRLGPGSAAEGQVVANFAALQLSAKRTDEAITLSREALALLEPALQPGDAKLAALRGTLGQALMFTDRPREAIPYLRAAYEARAQQAPDGHPAIIAARYQIAMAQRRIKAFDEAAAILANAETQVSAPAVPPHLRGLVLYELGILALERQDTTQARRLCGLAMQSLTQADVASAMANAQICLDAANSP